jgi:oligopeptide transport system substrate-binding protein
MQERGDLVKDRSGAWTRGPSLDWDVLPARVEGAIESRISRLDEELREILTLAAVEGEVFTAQVVARVLESAERSLLRMLSRELGERHKLVQEERHERTGRGQITRYRFGHQMFQRYLYDDLVEAERRLLHGEVGKALETVHEEKSDEMIVRLARHFDEAGNHEKAATYLLAAGDQARALYANDEAIDHYQRTLEHLRILRDDERLARTWMRLGLTYHHAFDYQRSRQAYDQGFAVWQRVRVNPREHQVGATVRVRQASPYTLDPSNIQHESSFIWVRQLFSGLVATDDKGTIVPDVARKWEIRADGHTYVFHLHKEARWSDGQPLTAGDFILAWRQALAPQAPDRLAHRLYDIQHAKALHQGQLADEDQLGLNAPDDHTLIIKLEQPTSYFLQVLATPFLRPVPKHLVSKFGDDWADPQRIVTNGPYVIASWSPGKAASLTRNPYYHGVFEGNVGQVEVKITEMIDHWQEAIADYGRGGVDVLEGTMFPGDAFRVARLQLGESYFNIPQGVTFSVRFNPSVWPVDDVRLRRALAMAIDRDHFVHTLALEQAVPAHGGWVAPGLPGHSPDIGLGFNPIAAQRLLAEAGYPEGEGLPELEMVWPDYPTNREQGNYLAEIWKEHLGVTIQPLYLPFYEWDKRIHSEPAAIHAFGWRADYPDPDNFLRSGSGRAIRKDEKFQAIIEEARRTMDQQKRLALYRQADKLLMDKALIIPLTYNLTHYFVSSRVRKFPATLRWQDIIINTDSEGR